MKRGRREEEQQKPRGSPSKSRKQTCVFTQIKKKKGKKKKHSFVPQPLLSTPPPCSPVPSFLPSLILSRERPGRARPERHLLHNVTGWNSKSFIYTRCLSSVCVRSDSRAALKGCGCLDACEISFYGCCDISSPGDDAE